MKSIEWFNNQIHKKQYGDYPNITYENIFEQAKEMHKNEIIESYCKGCFDISKDENIFPRETGEEYYKKNFINE